MNMGLDPRDPRYQQMVAQMMRTGKMPPAMTMESQVQEQLNPSSGMADPYGVPPNAAMQARTQDFTDRQSAVDSQREIAQQMRSGASPQGRTVGPLDVYVAPNWGEVVGDVATKLGGGYLEGRANKEGAKIDEARSDAAYETAKAEEKRYQDEQALKKSTLKVQEDTLKQRVANDLATLQEKRLARQEGAKGTWDGVSVHLPDGAPGTVVYNEKLGEYRFGNADGPKIPYAEAMKMIKYTAGADTGSVPASIQRDMMDRRAVANNIANSISTISAMKESGQNTSGIEGMVVDLVPKTFKGVAERTFFDDDEQKQRAKNALIDNLIKEAVTTGVVSDQDSNMLSGLYISGGGLSADQQLARLYAAQEILATYGIDLTTLVGSGATSLGGGDSDPLGIR